MAATAVVLLGFLVGLVSGATGIGGGTLLAPFLMFALKIDPFVSVGTDLFVSVITKAVGALIHKRADNVEMQSVLPLGVAGVIGGAIGIIALAFLKTHVDVHAGQTVLRHVIGITLCICALAIAVSSSLRARHARFDNAASLGIMGGIVSAITTVTGVGVGSLSVPALYFIKGRSGMAAIVGTSLVYATIVTAIGALAHMFFRDVNYGLAALLLLGSLPGVMVGSAFATRAPAALKPLIVALLVLSGMRLIV
jgi:uncharacterized membrane protein YfcA